MRSIANDIARILAFRNARITLAFGALALSFAGLYASAGAVDVRVVSGSPQTALAYAASTEPGYVTIFPQPFVVRVSGSIRSGASVRFRCVTPHCRFAASIQPDDVRRVDAQTYEVRVKDGSASLRPTIASDAPGTFTVEARSVARSGDRPGRVARFALTAR